MAFGWDSDMSKFGGDAQLAASVLNWDVLYKATVNELQTGKWKPAGKWWGVKEGAVDITSFSPKVPADVKTLALARRDALKTGSLHPFSGPLKDQAGKEVLASGKRYSDAELGKMNFYLQGVVGEVPK